MAGEAAGLEQSQTSMTGTYQVSAINGVTPGPVVGRGNRYEVSLHETGISVSLGCNTVAVAGAVVSNLFRASDPNGGLVTSPGTCGIPSDQQLEPRLHRHLLAGEVRVSTRADGLILTAPSLVIEGRAR